MDNFELDRKTRYQLRTIAGMQLQQTYEELASKAEPVFEPVVESNEPEMSTQELLEELRNMSPEAQRATLHFLIRDEYE